MTGTELTSAHTVEDLLRATHLFSELPPSAFDDLAATCTHVKVLAGQVLMRQGERGDTLYAVVSGRLRVTQHVDGIGSPEIVLGEVHQGEHFGEAAMVEGATRMATVTALTDCELIELSSQALSQFLERHREVRSNLDGTLAYRLQWASKRRLRPGREEILAALRQFMTELDAAALDVLEDEVGWLALPRGELLMRQGEQGDCLYIVVSGRLEVFGTRDDGSELRIAEVGPGESVGEMALLSNDSRVASVRVSRDSELLRLSKAGFDRLIHQHPRAMSVFTRQLGARLGRTIRARSLVTQLRTTSLATADECREIANLPEPVLRNLKITQMYHRLSLELTLLLGHQDANWCTFACNASKTAGYSIRREELPFFSVVVALRRHARTARMVDGLEERFSRSLAAEYAAACLSTVSCAIAAGNLKVFAELSPVFASFVSSFHQDREYDGGKLREFLCGLRPGTTDAGGQDTLADALAHYYEATFEPDPKKKSELILLGNILIGLHEQTRLQPQIIEALNAPLLMWLGDALGDGVQRGVGRILPRPLAHRLHARMDRSERRVVEALAAGWRRMVTRGLMSLRLPYGSLRLGADVPCLPDQRMHADMLQTLEHPGLVQLVRRFDTDEATLDQSRASDWGNLDDRMNFIVNLFRSRQKSLELFDQPFLMEQRHELARNRVPAGRL